MATFINFTRFARHGWARIRRLAGHDPLRHPLGRASDREIDQALGQHGLQRADLFSRGTTVAAHRRRLAEMLTVYHFSPRLVVARYWPQLKQADHVCAYCSDKARCRHWLRGRAADDAPKRFCPNVAAFERWRDDYVQNFGHDRIDGEEILEAGVAHTRELLRQQRSPGPATPKNR